MKFKAPIEVQAGISDGDPTNPLGISGYLLSSDGSNVNWVSPGDLSAETAEAIVQPIKANEALSKGDPLYIVGYQAGQNVNIVAKADSSDVAKMPVVGLADDDYANQTFGTMTAFGSFNGDFDTTGGTESWAVGDIIFVKPGGGLTNIKPGGTDLIQNVAIVSRVQSQTGELEVIALGRTNDVPNLPTGRLFVGTATNTSLISDVVYVDDANDRVGIGTTSPSARLEVQGGTTTSAVAFSTGPTVKIGDYAGIGNTRIFSNGLYIGYSTANSYHDFSNAGSSQMRITSSGNVGIGTTNPLAKLQVNTGSDINAQIGLDQFGSFKLGDVFGNYIGRGVFYSGSPGSEDLQALTNTFRISGGSGEGIQRVANGDVYLNSQSGVLATLDASTNNFGIGTTNPQSKLHVANGTLRTWTPSAGTTAIFESTQNSRSFITITGANEAELWFGDATTQTRGRVRYENNNDMMEFWTGATPRMYINSSGNVSIGDDTTSAKLEVRQAQNNGDTGAFTNTHVKLTSTTATDNTGFVGITAATSTSDNYGYSFGAQRTAGGVGNFKINYHNNSAAGTNRFIIDINGQVGIGTTSLNKNLNIGQISDSATDAGIFSNNQSRLYLTTATNTTASCGLHFGDSQFAEVNTRGKIEYNANVSPSSNYFQFRVNFSDAMRLGLNSSGAVRAGIGTTSPSSMLQVNGGVQLANDTDTASASKVGTFRYYTSGNNSYVDMCMQTGAATYAWVNIVQNTW